MKMQTGRDAQSGFTLVEIMISVAVLSVVLASMALVSQSTERAYGMGAVRAGLEQRAAATIERIVAELSIAVSDSLTPALVPGALVGGVQYVQATGLESGAVVLTLPRQLAFEYEVGEVNDGLDNNGNGLVDEGVIVLTEDWDTDPRRRVLTHWVRELAEGEEANGIDDNGNGLVDEAGFSIERVGETLTVLLTLEKRSPEGMPLGRTATTAMRLRN